MSDPNNQNHVSVELRIKSVDYYLSMLLVDNDQKLVLELGDMQSADTWKGVFEASYIEEMTRRTGNFKSFEIFVNMLKTALRKEKSTVSVDILTYADLEALKSKKSSVTCNSSTMSNNSNSNKRFLIMTYCVDFDKINYPLQLTYQGKTDINLLLETIKRLKSKIEVYETQDILKERDALKQEVARLRQEMKRENKRGSIDHNSNYDDEDDNEIMNGSKKSQGSTSRAEIKILQQIIKTIEEKSIKEKNVLQKQLTKKKQEVEVLKDQVTDLKITERNLRNEIKTLSAELRVFRQRRNSASGQQRSSSQESAHRQSLYRPSNYSHPAPIRANSPAINGHDSRRNGSHLRNNSSSSLQRKSISPSSSVRSINSVNSVGSRTSSLHRPRFDPTEFVRNKKLKQQETEMRKKKGFNYYVEPPKPKSNYMSDSNLSLTDSETCSYISESHRVRNTSRDQSKGGKVKDQHFLITPTSTPNRSLLGRETQSLSKFKPAPAASSASQNAKGLKSSSILNESKYLNDFQATNLIEIDSKLKSLHLLLKN